MNITVHGGGCKNCTMLFEKVKKLVSQSGINAEVNYNNDSNAMMGKGIIHLPALEVDGKVVCMGGVPNDKKLIKLLSAGSR